MGKTGKKQEDVEKDLIAVKEYYASLGYNHHEINKLVKNDMRDIVLIQIRIEDYQELLHVDRARVLKLIIEHPGLLGHETKGKHIPTSVESKMLDWQNTFHLDKLTVIQMIFSDPTMLNVGKLQNVLANYQRVLQADQATVKKIILKRTNLAPLDIDKNIVPTLTFYRDTLQIDQPTLTQMILQYPQMLSYDISASSSSVKSKIAKLNEVMPFTELRARVIKNPRILNAPAQNFKLRYMLAVLADDYAGKRYFPDGKEKSSVVEKFFNCGSIENQNTVYARLRYMMQHGIKAMCYLYYGENPFNRALGVKTEDLKQQYPLDANALNYIEQEYNRIQAKPEKQQKLCHLKFTPQELAAQHLKRCASGIIVPEEMGRAK